MVGVLLLLPRNILAFPIIGTINRILHIHIFYNNTDTTLHICIKFFVFSLKIIINMTARRHGGSKRKITSTFLGKWLEFDRVWNVKCVYGKRWTNNNNISKFVSFVVYTLNSYCLSLLHGHRREESQTNEPKNRNLWIEHTHLIKRKRYNGK